MNALCQGCALVKLVLQKSPEITESKHRSGSGGGRSEAITNIYYSDRQLPPGHDPGADSCEAPTAGSVAHSH
jgi:hypothetical protein